MSAPGLPVESVQPVRWFAGARMFLAGAALVSVAFFNQPHQGRLALVLGLAAVPWSAGVLAIAYRRPQEALSSWVAIVDMVLLGVVQLVAPDSYAGVRFVALFLVASHANFQGERRGLLVAVAAILALVAASPFLDVPPSDGLLAFYEVMFALSALCCGLFVGRLRTTESAARIRARDVSRRAIEAEGRMRRRIAESIHDGPVQELVSLDLILTAADQAAARGEAELTRERVAEARTLAERNIAALRDEIVGLGPYAFEELTFAVAVEQCQAVWERRYGFQLELAMDPLDLPDNVSGALFGIAQEAVTNAGRHAQAERVIITLRPVEGEVELRISDDGRGFGDVDPLDSSEPGHIGLASMHERAELVGGRLEIETSERGTKVVARVPLRTPTAGPRRLAGERPG